MGMGKRHWSLLFLPLASFLSVAYAQTIINPGSNPTPACPTSPAQFSADRMTGKSSCQAPEISNKSFSVSFGAGAPPGYAGIGGQQPGIAGAEAHAEALIGD